MLEQELHDMRLPRVSKQYHAWRTIACFAVLGLIAFWTISRTPRFEARHEAAYSAVQYGSVTKPTIGDSTVEYSTTSTNRLRLLLSTHNRLFWYYPDTQEDVPVHKGDVCNHYYDTSDDLSLLLFAGRERGDGALCVCVLCVQ